MPKLYLPLDCFALLAWLVGVYVWRWFGNIAKIVDNMAKTENWININTRQQISKQNALTVKPVEKLPSEIMNKWENSNVRKSLIYRCISRSQFYILSIIFTRFTVPNQSTDRPPSISLHPVNTTSNAKIKCKHNFD